MSGTQSTSNQIVHQRTPSIMTASTTTIQSVTSTNLPKSRFPRLQECAHFHYEVSTIDIPKNFRVAMCREIDEKSNSNNNANNSTGHSLTASTMSSLSNGGSNNYTGSDSTIWFQLQVTSNEKRWNIYRTNDNFRYLDKHLHDCIFDRKFSNLEEPISFNSIASNDSMSTSAVSFKNNKTPNSKSGIDSSAYKKIRNGLAAYLERFCEIAFINAINCGPILNWFEIDNKGNRLFAIDDSPINIPGVAAAVVKKRYVAQGLDEISLEVGNMISVIDMPPIDESSWWRGKKGLEVGFFPLECVELIRSNHHLTSHVTEHLPQINSNQSVRLKHGKLVTILRSFFNTRPARMQLQSKGILKQRVFACDLGEHLSNTQQNVPQILKICTEFIEKYGTVDGIYRHTGLQSNIQRLRNAFDEEKWNEIEQETYINDVHSVSSLLKMYFRELPNPLLTFQLYHKFILLAEELMRAVNIEDKIIEIYDVVQQLPPPHYRTLVFLMQHLRKMSDFSAETNMNTKNLAIVWAPNLLKSKEMDGNNAMQLDMLHSITLQANISEFLIANADTIFNDKFASLVRKPDHKSNIAKAYRPISVCHSNAGGSKLLSLEEAQDKYRQVGPTDMPKYHTVIEIPDKQKKKQKEKKNNQTANSTTNQASMIQQPAANLQIQQQFENLQQQQTQLTSSASFHCVSSAVNNTPTKQPNVSNGQPSTCPSNGNSSSPAFKSIFKNFRGSLKHQSSNSSSTNNISVSDGLELVKQGFDDEGFKNLSTPPNNNANSQFSNQSSLNRKNSSAYKNTLMTTSVCSMNSPNMERKLDYSSCISQLQSAAAQAINSKTNVNNSTAPTTGVSNSGESISPAPVLFRNNKFNQSMNSNHSNNKINVENNQQVLNNLLDKLNDTSGNNQQQTVLSTFNKDINTPKTNNENRINPVPSKRRTIQGPPTGSTSSISSFQKPIAPMLTNNNNSNDNTVEIKNIQPSPKYDKNETEKVPECMKETNDEMQELVAYINQFEKENISNAVQNDAYIEMNQNQLDKLNTNLIQETESKTVIPLVSPTAEIDETEPVTSKLRLSSSSLSSSNDSLNANNLISEQVDEFDNAPNMKSKIVDEQPQVLPRNKKNTKSPDRRTYVINKIYDKYEHDSQDDNVLNQNGLSTNNETDDQYEKVILTSPSYAKNDLIELIQNDFNSDPVYANVTSTEPKFDKNVIRSSLGFDVNGIIAENQAGSNQQYIHSDANKDNEYKRLSSSSTERNQDENFDSELIELNNQIKQLLISNEKTMMNSNVNDIKQETIDYEKNPKPIPVTRPKSVNFLNSKKACAPPPPPSSQYQIASQTKNQSESGNNSDKRSNDAKKLKEMTETSSNRMNDLSDENPDKNKASFLSKSTSIDEIKSKCHKPIKQIRHSFRMAPTETDTIFHQFTTHDLSADHQKLNETINEINKEEPELAQKIQNHKSMSQSLQDCNSNIQKNNSPRKLRKQQPAITEIAHEQPQLVKIVNNLEKLDVKTKIKLMESFVSTNPISISKSNERSASTSSTDSTSSSTSSSSKSPPISPKDTWIESTECNVKIKESSQPPNVMTRSHISYQNSEPNQNNQISSRSLSQISSNALSNENLAPKNLEKISPESVTVTNTQQKQTLIECSNLSNSDNILVNELNDANQIFDKMSFDKIANDILLTKPSPQSLASLKEKRRTVKELMCKFEHK